MCMCTELIGHELPQTNDWQIDAIFYILHSYCYNIYFIFQPMDWWISYVTWSHAQLPNGM